MSGKKVVLLGDLGTDHEGFPPTPVINGSPDVLIDGKPVARVGDQLAQHSKPKHSPHPRTIASGSSTVFINGLPVATTGGAISLFVGRVPLMASTLRMDLSPRTT